MCCRLSLETEKCQYEFLTYRSCCFILRSLVTSITTIWCYSNSFRPHPSHIFADKMETSPEKRNAPLHPPPIESIIAPVPKKARYHDSARHGVGAPSWNQPLRIDTSMDANKMQVGAVKEKVKMFKPAMIICTVMLVLLQPIG